MFRLICKRHFELSLTLIQHCRYNKRAAKDITFNRFVILVKLSDFLYVYVLAFINMANLTGSLVSIAMEYGDCKSDIC